MRHFMMVAIMAFAPPQAAVAEDVIDIGPTEACLGEALSVHDKVACVGLAAEACAEAAVGGFSTRTMTGCLAQEGAYFDDLLNTEYQRVRALAREADQFGVPTFGDTAPMTDRLVEMQRAWITYRDATCAYERRQFEGGTLGDLVYVDCMMQLTAAQAFRLQDSVLGM